MDQTVTGYLRYAAATIEPSGLMTFADGDFKLVPWKVSTSLRSDASVSAHVAICPSSGTLRRHRRLGAIRRVYCVPKSSSISNSMPYGFSKRCSNSPVSGDHSSVVTDP